MAPRKRRVRSTAPVSHNNADGPSGSHNRSPPLHGSRAEESGEGGSNGSGTKRRGGGGGGSSEHAFSPGSMNGSEHTNGSGHGHGGGGGGGGGGNGNGNGNGNGTNSASTANGSSIAASPSADVDPADFSKLNPVHPPKALRDARDNAAGLDGGTFSVASVAFALFDGLVDWAVREVSVQYKASASRLQTERKRMRVLEAGRGSAAASTTTGRGTGGDGDGHAHAHGHDGNASATAGGAYGSRLVYSDKNVTVVCSICSSNISASRYAQHVEKCMGRGGRMSSRAATARLRASVERSEKEAASELDAAPVQRRRRHSATVDADVGSGGGGGADGSGAGSHKRRKMSPVPGGAGGGAGSGSQGSYHARGLPPSGRTRGSPR